MSWGRSSLVVGHEPATTQMKAPRYRRATIAETAKGEGKFSRPGHYGHVVVRIEPSARGKGVEVLSDIAGAAIPEGYVKSASDGVREALHGGAVPGCRVVDVVVHVVGGSCHPTDSSEWGL
jgi:elongation factor G